MKLENDDIGQEVYDVMNHIREHGIPPEAFQKPVYMETHSLIPIPFFRRFRVMLYVLIGRPFHFVNNIIITPDGMENHARLNFEISDEDFNSEGYQH